MGGRVFYSGSRDLCVVFREGYWRVKREETVGVVIILKCFVLL